MKNHIRIAKASARIVQSDTATWIPLYYSPSKKEVYTTDGEGRFFLTKLIRENTAKEVEDTVIKMLMY